MYEYARLVAQDKKIEVCFARTKKKRTFLGTSDAINELASLGFRMITYTYGPDGNGLFCEVYMFERLIKDD